MDRVSNRTLRPFQSKLLVLIVWLLSEGCVEHYTFIVKDENPTLVVEAAISDKSFSETLMYPSDGRYFTAKVSTTTDVINTRALPLRDAIVELVADDEEPLRYTETAPGLYSLLDSAFKAQEGARYKLRITTQQEEVYESDWATLPAASAPPMGDIGFTEGEKEVFVMEANEWVPRRRDIVTVHVDLPVNDSGNRINYRWTFSPTWIYRAPLIPPSDPVGTCWATEKNFINTYSLQQDLEGGYKKPLFELFTVREHRLYEMLSVLVIQYALDEKFYQFWDEMKARNEGSSLQDTPPFNLETNFRCLTGEEKVSGYFGVAYEQARRWYFSKDDLSYYVENTLAADCLALDIAPECLNCLLYSFGTVTNVQPTWWGK